MKEQVFVSQQQGQKDTPATDLYTHVEQKQQRDAIKEISENSYKKTNE